MRWGSTGWWALVLSVLISGVVSFLPLIFPSLLFLSFPGAMLTLLVFGRQVQLTSQLVRAVSNFAVWSVALYFLPSLWKWGQNHPTRHTPTPAKALFILWLVLLLPWFLFAGLSGMAFDGGPTAEAYTVVWSVWTYPITLGIVAVWRRWVPWIVILPFLNVVGCGASELLHKST